MANEAAKRALEVAKAGNHSILLVGNDEAKRLAEGYNKAIAWKPCLCGNFGFGNRIKPCTCTPSEMRKHQEKQPTADLQVEVVNPTYEGWEKEFSSYLPKSQLSPEASTFFEKAYDKLGFSPSQAEKVLKVAQTIKDLNHHQKIELPDLAEAVQYQRR